MIVDPEASVRVPPYLGFSAVGAAVVGVFEVVDGAADVVVEAVLVVGVLGVPHETRRLTAETIADSNNTTFLFTFPSRMTVSRTTWR